MIDYLPLLRRLTDGKVEFILVGGVAAVLHGASRFTQDVDVVYRRTPDNLDRLAAALAPLHPRPRGAPPGLPFRWDAETLARGLNFTLATDHGPLDAFGEIVGGGDYDALAPHTIERDLDGLRLRCLDLPTLIKVKRAAGRPKDFEAIAELELLLEDGGG